MDTTKNCSICSFPHNSNYCPTLVCEICGINGHQKFKCRYFHYGSKLPSCTKCNILGHTHSQCKRNGNIPKVDTENTPVTTKKVSPRSSRVGSLIITKPILSSSGNGDEKSVITLANPFAGLEEFDHHGPEINVIFDYAPGANFISLSTSPVVHSTNEELHEVRKQIAFYEGIAKTENDRLERTVHEHLHDGWIHMDSTCERMKTKPYPVTVAQIEKFNRSQAPLVLLPPSALTSVCGSSENGTKRVHSSHSESEFPFFPLPGDDEVSVSDSCESSESDDSDTVPFLWTADSGFLESLNHALGGCDLPDVPDAADLIIDEQGWIAFTAPLSASIPSLSPRPRDAEPAFLPFVAPTATSVHLDVASRSGSTGGPSSPAIPRPKRKLPHVHGTEEVEFDAEYEDPTGPYHEREVHPAPEARSISTKRLKRVAQALNLKVRWHELAPKRIDRFLLLTSILAFMIILAGLFAVRAILNVPIPSLLLNLWSSNLILLTVCAIVVYFVRGHRHKIREWKVTGLIDADAHDLRPDAIAMGELLHTDAFYARVTFSSSWLIDWLYPIRRVLNATGKSHICKDVFGLPATLDTIISLELYSQLTTAQIEDYTLDDHTIRSRMQFKASNVHSINIDRWKSVGNENVIADTVQFAFDSYLMRKQQRVQAGYYFPLGPTLPSA